MKIINTKFFFPLVVPNSSIPLHILCIQYISFFLSQFSIHIVLFFAWFVYFLLFTHKFTYFSKMMICFSFCRNVFSNFVSFWPCLLNERMNFVDLRFIIFLHKPFSSFFWIFFYIFPKIDVWRMANMKNIKFSFLWFRWLWLNDFFYYL